jgi:hypothetical protein
MSYRLGATPRKHGQSDCLSLASTVLQWYGIDVPKPKRDWYRRLRNDDYSVFPEELEKWGKKTDTPTIGVVALCSAGEGYGLAVYYEEGWLSFVESVVAWSPTNALPVVGLYCRRKQTSAMPSG